MKLYEIILRKIGLWKDCDKPGKAQEDIIMIYNPIECKVGDIVKIDALDFRDYRFTVKDIIEYSISVGNNNHRMVDYVLLCASAGMTYRLRMVPDPDSQSNTTHRAMILKLYDEIPYDEGLHAVVKDDTKKFVIDDDTDPDNIIHEEFWRVNDVGISYDAKVTTLNITHESWTVDDTGTSQSKLTKGQTYTVVFWDYSRMTDIEGVEVEEFLFVEMDKSSGYFSIWRGSEVNPERVEVF